MAQTTIFSARKIVTMNRQNPVASHVAVRDGRVLGVGSLAELKTWGGYRLDERFVDKVLLPGFVEGHAHAMEGTFWRFVYCGYFDRTDAEGKIWTGVQSVEAMVERLSRAEAELTDPDSPLSGWQLDPIYMHNRRITRQELDQISHTRPIGVMHASGHTMNVNSKALEMAGLLKIGINHPGILLGGDGLPTGALYGPDAMTPVGHHVGFAKAMTDCDEAGLREFAKLCVRAGVTTVTDLAAMLDHDTVSMMLRVTGEDRFPVRLVPLRYFVGMSPKETITMATRLRGQATDLLRLGRIKVVADGSIQGFSARLRWPGYHNGAPNGLWYNTPEQLSELFRLALAKDIQVHIHTNGDEATEMVLDVLGPALMDHPRPDHRFTLQHCQLADAAQFRRMKALGLCVNLFANHHFYWGDQHYALTVGPERAQRMNACRTALDTGVPMAIHSDAPVTPLGPLFTAWSAVNRITASGRVQGEAEKITIPQALWAITMGAAYTLQMDGEIGSIEVGKRADFAVLNGDPTNCDGAKLKDVGIWGTVQSGRVFEASRQ